VLLLPLGREARVTLVHVAAGRLVRDERGEHAPRTLLQREANRFRERLDSMGRADVELRPILATPGPAFARIITFARSTRAQLVVVGRHGQGLRSLLVGSTAERIVRGRVAPVLVVSQPPGKGYARPLVALDPNERSGRRALKVALRVLDASVRRVDVASAFEIFYEGHLHRAGSSRVEIQKLRQFGADRQRRSLLHQLRGVNSGPARLVAAVRRGDPRRVIPAIANRRKSDLIVLGTHARRGLARFLLGSVAVEVLRSASERPVRSRR
jgi:nucleotide-binding universal stress UspA family protein